MPAVLLRSLIAVPESGGSNACGGRYHRRRHSQLGAGGLVVSQATAREAQFALPATHVLVFLRLAQEGRPS